eukprot:GILK01015142.1.p3 GENE.GILK01015142.1~~GILK01015142.1.p3  ORF type:complete len:113 (-),score=0.20 GILK01015142.1:277-615(-)
MVAAGNCTRVANNEVEVVMVIAAPHLKWDHLACTDLLGDMLGPLLLSAVDEEHQGLLVGCRRVIRFAIVVIGAAHDCRPNATVTLFVERHRLRASRGGRCVPARVVVLKCSL